MHRGQWDDLKVEIVRRGLNPSLQRELAAVAAYFTPRIHAAHGATVVASVGQRSQIVRLSHDKQHTARAEQVTLAALRAKCATARGGHNAIQAVGRALDDHGPTVLATMNAIAKAMLIGRV